MTLLRAAALAALAAAAGCATPSPAFTGIDPVRIETPSRLFDVYVRNRSAQAVRINNEWGADRDAVIADAVEAIERVSRCSVVHGSVTGDVGVVVARLAC